MLTDWFTIGAQILNFLILVWLLKHFLYDRIIRAMNEREEKVKSRLEEAEEQEENSKKEAEEYRKKQEDLEKQKDEILEKAKKEAAGKKEELMREAKKERDNLQQSWRESIERDKQLFMDDLRRMAIREVIAISGRMMKELADEDLESRMVEMFVKKIKDMDEEEKNRLRNGDGTTEKAAATVAHAFELSDSGKKKITRVLHDEISRDLEVDYETDADLIAGIRLRMDDKRLSWNVKDALGEIENRAEKMLEEKSRLPGEEKKAESGENKNGGSDQSS